MAEIKNYIITKDDKIGTIKYVSFTKSKGYKIRPKKNFKAEEMVNVSEMVFINPSLIEKLIRKKCNRTLEKIILMMNVLYEDDSDTDPPFDLALGEIEKFESQIRKKYQKYLPKKEINLLINKLDILSGELKLREKVFAESLKPKKSR